MSICAAARKSAMTAGSCDPRELPNTVPPQLVDLLNVIFGPGRHPAAIAANPEIQSVVVWPSADETPIETYNSRSDSAS